MPLAMYTVIYEVLSTSKLQANRAISLMAVNVLSAANGPVA